MEICNVNMHTVVTTKVEMFEVTAGGVETTVLV